MIEQREESDDPERAAHYFHAAMIANGIARRSGPIPVEYMGLRLVQANQAIDPEEALQMWAWRMREAARAACW